LLGCVVAIVTAIVIFPVSGTATCAGAAVEALAECEAAVSALSDGLASALSSEESPSSEEYTLGIKGGKAAWAEVEGHLKAAEAANKIMSIYLSSLKAYPISTYLARLSEGATLVDTLVKKSPSIFITLNVGDE
jgi:hypothetical protein